MQSLFSELYQTQIPFSLSFRLKRIGHGDPPFCSRLVCAFLGFKKKKKIVHLSKPNSLLFTFFFYHSVFLLFFFLCIYIWVRLTCALRAHVKLSVFGNIFSEIEKAVITFSILEKIFLKTERLGTH